MTFKSLYQHKVLLLEANYHYTIPKDKELLMYDFYFMFHWLNSLDYSPGESTNQDMEGNKESLPTHRMGLRDSTKFSFDEIKQQLINYLKPELLDATFFSIACETRHWNDYDNKDALKDRHVFSEEEEKWLYYFTQNYKKLELLQTNSDIYNNEIKRIADKTGIKDIEEVKKNDSNYKNSYLAAKKTINKFNIPEIDFVIMAKKVFEQPLSRKDKEDRGDKVQAYDRKKHLSWSTSYGGNAWASICDAYIKLSTAKTEMKNVIYIDNIYHQQHNTGSVFTKVKKYYKDGYSWILSALNFKANNKEPWELIKKIVTLNKGNLRNVDKMYIEMLKAAGKQTYNDFFKVAKEVKRKEPEQKPLLNDKGLNINDAIKYKKYGEQAYLEVIKNGFVFIGKGGPDSLARQIYLIKHDILYTLSDYGLGGITPDKGGTGSSSNILYFIRDEEWNKLFNQPEVKLDAEDIKANQFKKEGEKLYPALFDKGYIYVGKGGTGTVALNIRKFSKPKIKLFAMHESEHPLESMLIANATGVEKQFNYFIKDEEWNKVFKSDKNSQIDFKKWEDTAKEYAKLGKTKFPNITSGNLTFIGIGGLGHGISPIEEIFNSGKYKVFGLDYIGSNWLMTPDDKTKVHHIFSYHPDSKILYFMFTKDWESIFGKTDIDITSVGWEKEANELKKKGETEFPKLWDDGMIYVGTGHGIGLKEQESLSSYISKKLKEKGNKQGLYYMVKDEAIDSKTGLSTGGSGIGHSSEYFITKDQWDSVFGAEGLNEDDKEKQEEYNYLQKKIDETYIKFPKLYIAGYYYIGEAVMKSFKFIKKEILDLINNSKVFFCDFTDERELSSSTSLDNPDMLKPTSYGDVDIPYFIKGEDVQPLLDKLSPIAKKLPEPDLNFDDIPHSSKDEKDKLKKLQKYGEDHYPKLFKRGYIYIGQEPFLKLFSPTFKKLLNDGKVLTTYGGDDSAMLMVETAGIHQHPYFVKEEDWNKLVEDKQDEFVDEGIIKKAKDYKQIGEKDFPKISQKLTYIGDVDTNLPSYCFQKNIELLKLDYGNHIGDIELDYENHIGDIDNIGLLDKEKDSLSNGNYYFINHDDWNKLFLNKESKEDDLKEDAIKFKKQGEKEYSTIINSRIKSDDGMVYIGSEDDKLIKYVSKTLGYTAYMGPTSMDIPTLLHFVIKDTDLNEPGTAFFVTKYVWEFAFGKIKDDENIEYLKPVAINIKIHGEQEYSKIIKFNDLVYVGKGGVNSFVAQLKKATHVDTYAIQKNVDINDPVNLNFHVNYNTINVNYIFFIEKKEWEKIFGEIKDNTKPKTDLEPYKKGAEIKDNTKPKTDLEPYKKGAEIKADVGKHNYKTAYDKGFIFLGYNATSVVKILFNEYSDEVVLYEFNIAGDMYIADNIYNDDSAFFIKKEDFDKLFFGEIKEDSIDDKIPEATTPIREKMNLELYAKLTKEMFPALAKNEFVFIGKGPLKLNFSKGKLEEIENENKLYIVAEDNPDSIFVSHSLKHNHYYFVKSIVWNDLIKQYENENKITDTDLGINKEAELIKIYGVNHFPKSFNNGYNFVGGYKHNMKANQVLEYINKNNITIFSIESPEDNPADLQKTKDITEKKKSYFIKYGDWNKLFDTITNKKEESVDEQTQLMINGRDTKTKYPDQWNIGYVYVGHGPFIYNLKKNKDIVNKLRIDGKFFILTYIDNKIDSTKTFIYNIPYFVKEEDWGKLLHPYVSSDTTKDEQEKEEQLKYLNDCIKQTQTKFPNLFNAGYKYIGESPITKYTQALDLIKKFIKRGELWVDLQHYKDMKDMKETDLHKSATGEGSLLSYFTNQMDAQQLYNALFTGI